MSLELTDPILLDKLIKLVESLKSSFPNTCCFKVKEAKRLLNPLGKYLMNNNSIFSYHFKRMHRAKFNSTHPSIATRKRDKLFFPDKETFDLSFRKIFSLPIFLHYKNFFFEQFLRILPSKNKLFKFNIADTNMCIKCNEICTIEHSLFYCIFPKYFIHILARFLDYKYNNCRPEFIFLKENFYLFNIFYEEFSTNDYLQLTHLILITKDRSLKISYDKCLLRWNANNFYAQTLLIIQFAFKLLSNAGHETNMITEFENFVLNM